MHGQCDGYGTGGEERWRNLKIKYVKKMQNMLI